jgi:ABC-type branched-subunit amino acid transport system ATPase component
MVRKMDNSSQGSSVLRLERISKSFGGLQVLTDIDLSLEQHKIVGLIGPNGAGKSTLFNVITSLYKPDGSDVFLQGQKITGLTFKPLIAMQWWNGERMPVYPPVPSVWKLKLAPTTWQ